KERLATIRMLQAAIKQREVDERITLDDAQVLAAIEKMIKQRKEAISQFEAGGRADLAEKEAGEIKQLQAYLPQQLSAAELRFDESADGAHIGTACGAGFDEGHDFAHVFDVGGAGFGDRSNNESFKLGGRELLRQISLQLLDLGGFFFGEIRAAARFELADGLFALLDHLFDGRKHLRVVEHDALIDFALLDRSLQHTNGRETLLVTGAHRVLHILSDALFERHRGPLRIYELNQRARGALIRGEERFCAYALASAFRRIRGGAAR
ncbi:MAG: hypothetical protein EBU76_03360, partial [Gammaproteobacteria bacterium]|nr:hypothetical protein [Gammaproteobacteria bacterium]